MNIVPFDPQALDTLKKGKSGTLVGLTPNDFKEIYYSFKEPLEKMLGNAAFTERFIQAAILVSQRPDIMACDAASVFGAVFTAATLNLSLSPAVGHCYIIPYSINVGDKNSPVWKTVAQFQIGYLGFTELMYRAGMKSIYANVVKEADIFDFEYGTSAFLKHKPLLQEESQVKFVYVTWELMTGGKGHHVLPVKEIERLRMRNRMQVKGVTGAWLTDYDNMAKAKIIKQARKFLPVSALLERALQADEAVIVSDLQTGELKTLPESHDDKALLTDGTIQPESGERTELLQKIKTTVGEKPTVEALKIYIDENPDYLSDKEILSFFTARKQAIRQSEKREQLANIQGGCECCHTEYELQMFLSEHPEWLDDKLILSVFDARKAQILKEIANQAKAA